MSDMVYADSSYPFISDGPPYTAVISTPEGIVRVEVHPTLDAASAHLRRIGYVRQNIGMFAADIHRFTMTVPGQTYTAEVVLACTIRCTIGGVK